MADEKSPDEGVDEAAEPENEEIETTEADGDVEKDVSEGENEDAPPTVESLSAALSEAEVQVAESKDQALRAKADVENMRRRAPREVESAHKYALENLLGELLPVLDSLEKAVESAEVAKDAGAIGEGL